MPNNDPTIDELSAKRVSKMDATTLSYQLGPRGPYEADTRAAIERIGFITDAMSPAEMRGLAYYMVGRFPAQVAAALAELHPVYAERIVLTWHPIGDPACIPSKCTYCFDVDEDDDLDAPIPYWLPKDE